MGLGTVTIAHAAFGTAFVAAVVRSRLLQLDGSLEEASQDLGAGWLTTFLRVTLPSIAPAVLAGALLAFTLSLDEFVIAFFTNGPNSPTLPIVIYAHGPLRGHPRDQRAGHLAAARELSRWWPPPWPPAYGGS